MLDGLLYSSYREIVGIDFSCLYLVNFHHQKCVDEIADCEQCCRFSDIDARSGGFSKALATNLTNLATKKNQDF